MTKPGESNVKTIASLMAAALLVGGGLAHAQRVTSPAGPDMDSARGEAYDGPKARIVVADFEDKMSSSGQYRSEYGRGMSDMLKTALFQTNRYVLLEREKMAAVEAERARRTARNAPAKVEIEDADIVVTAAITGFDAESGGADIGKNVGGSLGTFLGAVTGSFRQARVAMDIRMIDVDTGRVIAATSVEATANSYGGGSTGGAMGGALSGFSRGPMEGAIRQMIQQAVSFVVGRTPQTYYRYQ
jgi:curli biogenesis system outer membrane secretion channel CsgG